MFRSAIVAALVLLAGCGADGSASGAGNDTSIEGVWLLESFTEDGDQEQVQIGTNTAQQPWIEISATAMTGKAGCNSFDVYEEVKDPYTYEDETLILGQSSMTAASCMSENGNDIMAVEELFTDFLWQHPDGIDVETLDDEMIWRARDVELFFRSTPERPVRPPPPPQTAFGPLDCSPGVVAEEIVDGDGRTTEKILLDYVPAVVRTEADLDFSPPAPSDWFWRGYDETDTLIVFIARGDVEPPIYQVVTCTDE
jgi:hypothetical protein